SRAYLLSAPGRPEGLPSLYARGAAVESRGARVSLSAGAGAATALAGGEARGAARAVLEHLRARRGLQRKRLVERHAEALDGGAAVGEHRALRKARKSVGELQRAVQVRARRDELGQQAHG